MNLERVKISNFKGIGQVDLELKPGFNLIIGENGKGKTSIMEAIAVGLGGVIAGIDDVTTRHFTKNEIRMVFNTLGDGAYNRKYIMPMEVECCAEIDNVSYTWKRTRSSLKASRSTVQPRTIAKLAAEWIQDDDKILPVINYQSAARVWSQKREKTENIFRKNYFRTVGYIDCLTEESNVKLLLNWCARMEQISWQKGKKIAEYEAVKAAVAKVISIINNQMCKVFYDKQSEELLCQIGQEMLPIQALSAGYQSLIWMVLDIAYRMAVLNPQLCQEITKSSGIVLIDEIDMHLHPRWQWKIIDALQGIFPNVQFIATTHSPIIIASAKNTWLIDISDLEKVDYALSNYGIDVNDSLRLVQNTNEMPVWIKTKLVDFYKCIDDEELERARIILEDLENEIGKDIPITVNARAMYELEKPFVED